MLEYKQNIIPSILKYEFRYDEVITSLINYDCIYNRTIENLLLEGYRVEDILFHIDEELEVKFNSLIKKR